MKLIYVAMGLLTLYSIYKYTKNGVDLLQEFKIFQNKYNKQYLPEDEKFRFKIFSENKKLIDDHNNTRE